MLTNLEITELKIFPTKNLDTSVIAVCVATFNNALVVSGLKIKESKQGIYVAFPFQRNSDGIHSRVYPVNEEVRKEISNRILATYVINHCVEDYAV